VYKFPVQGRNFMGKSCLESKSSELLSRRANQAFVLKMVLAINLLMVTVEFNAGFLAYSTALMGDSLVGWTQTRWPELVAGLIISILLLRSAWPILVDSVTVIRSSVTGENV